MNGKLHRFNSNYQFIHISGVYYDSYAVKRKLKKKKVTYNNTAHQIQTWDAFRNDDYSYKIGKILTPSCG